jgi:hypothetical protein
MNSANKSTDDASCLTVFTCRGLQRILREGGSQAWRISSHHAAKSQYIVCIQNRNYTWGNATHPHGTAFLVGKISEIRPVSTSENGVVRKIVEISEYAEINVPHGVPNGRNPIAYMKLSDFGLKLSDLEFKPVPKTSEQLSIDGLHEDSDEELLEDEPEKEEGLTIDQAKRRLAIGLGVSMDKIEIIIRA